VLHRSRTGALRGALLLGVVVLAGGVPGGAAAAAAPSRLDLLVPKPISAVARPGAPFVLRRGSRILIGTPRARPVALLLAGVLRRSTGYPLPLASGRPRLGDVVLELRRGAAPQGHAAEGYVIRIGGATATISADHPQGLFDGVQTFRQLLPPFVESRTPVIGPWTAPAAVIRDYPRFGYRGAMLDVARSFLTVGEVERYIDDMVQFKLDVLHLHLTDDQAWRIQITPPATNPFALDFGALTQIGGRGAVDFFGPGAPAGTEAGHRGWYSQADYRAIVRYAQARYVTVVPEVDGPGHSNAALASIPQLDASGTRAPMNDTTATGYASLDDSLPATHAFLSTVWSELAALTPGPYAHVGGDEAWLTPPDQYARYMGDVVSLVRAAGKTPIGWNQYASTDLPPGSIIQYWYGRMDDVLARVAQGAKVLMSPAGTTYLSKKYSASSPIGMATGCTESCGWDAYYDWDPVQSGLTEPDVIGVEAPLWSETVRGIAQTEWLSFPRLVSLAEVGWTPQADRAVADFGRRLAALGARLTAEGTNFYAAPNVGWTVDAAGLTLVAHRLRLGAVAVGRFSAPAAPARAAQATVSFGDGTRPVPARVVQPNPGTALSANGLFSVTVGGHRYRRPGSYPGTVRITTPQGTATTTFAVRALR